MSPRSAASFRSARRAIRFPSVATLTPPIRADRTPVLTIWATVVTERRGYSLRTYVS
jgi:hypothetical protein